MSDRGRLLAELQAELESLGDPERAVQEKRYLKSPFRFHGVTMPKLRAISKRIHNENRTLSKEALWDECRTLWASDWHEERALAIFLLDEFSSLLGYEDMPALERMLRESVNWDQVDDISAHLVGAVLKKDARAFEYLRRWSTDDSFWLRRAAMLSQLQLFRARTGDRPLFYSFADRMLEEKEFFIRKAIGWVLREIARVEPEEVYRYVLANRSRMSGVTLREAVRRLPEDLQEKLRAGPPAE